MQLCAFEIVAIEGMQHLAQECEPSTFMGLIIQQDQSMNENVCEFLDDCGAVIAVINNLAAHVGLSAPIN